MSAITGSGDRRTIVLSAAASSFFGTATRTSSQPADASAAICAVVASTSCVGVSVIDWTATGAPPPIVTLPTLTRYRLPTAASVTAGFKTEPSPGGRGREAPHRPYSRADRAALLRRAAAGRTRGFPHER